MTASRIAPHLVAALVLLSGCSSETTGSPTLPSPEAGTQITPDGGRDLPDGELPTRRDGGVVPPEAGQRPDGGIRPDGGRLDGGGRDAFVPPVDSGGDDGAVDPKDGGTPPPDAGAGSNVIGNAGIALWDSLAFDQKETVRTGFRSFFLHQSVGGDLEDGSKANFYNFEYVESGSTNLSMGLNGGLFNASNGSYSAKIAEYKTMALANRANARVAIMKFGYADVLSNTLAAAQTEYKAAVDEVRAAGVAVLHVTPPFVYNAPDENEPKMQMRQWMIDTFPSDVIFDLQDLESTRPGTGGRCERGGSWEICDEVRSTASCPSLNQGIDNPAGGQGHLCAEPHARLFAKSFLYAIYKAGMSF